MPELFQRAVVAFDVKGFNRFRTWQCEVAGQSGAGCDGVSGKVGNGPRATADQQAYEQDKAAYEAIATRLRQAQAVQAQAQAVADKDNASVLVQDQEQARQDLAVQTPIRDRLQSGTEAQSAAGFQANQVAVLALFFLIEILPVTVKFLLNLGPESAYDAALKRENEKVTGKRPVNKRDLLELARERQKIIQSESRDRIERAEIESRDQVMEAQVQERIRSHMRERKERLGYMANEYVATEMEKILKEEPRRWSSRMHGGKAGHDNGSGPGTNGSARQTSRGAG